MDKGYQDVASLVPWTFWCVVAVIFSKEDRARRSLSQLMSSEMLAVELPTAGSVWVELEPVNVAYLSSLWALFSQRDGRCVAGAVCSSLIYCG